MRVTLGSLEIQRDFVQQSAQQLFAIAVRSGGGVPDLTNIGAEHLSTLELLSVECLGPLLFAAPMFGLYGRQIAEPFRHLAFQAAGTQRNLRLPVMVTGCATCIL